MRKRAGERIDDQLGKDSSIVPNRFEPTLGQKVAGHFLSVFTTIGFLIGILAIFTINYLIVDSEFLQGESWALLAALVLSFLVTAGLRFMSTAAHFLTGSYQFRKERSYLQNLLLRIFWEILFFQGVILMGVAMLYFLSETDSAFAVVPLGIGLTTFLVSVHRLHRLGASSE